MLRKQHQAIISTDADLLLIEHILIRLTQEIDICIQENRLENVTNKTLIIVRKY